MNLPWWDRKAANAPTIILNQDTARQQAAKNFVSYSDREAQHANVESRVHLIEIASQLSSLNRQMATLQIIAGAGVVLALIALFRP